VPNFPDIPGKSLIGGTTKRVRVVAAAGAGAALAVGGVVAKRVLGHSGKDEGTTDSGDRGPAEVDDNVVPIAKEKAPPKPKPAKPKAAKAKPKAASKPRADKAKPPKPKAAAEKSKPAGPDGAPFGEEPHPATGSESTSEPPLEDDPEHPEGGRPPRRENLDQ
jgi:hypothetical protein